MLTDSKLEAMQRLADTARLYPFGTSGVVDAQKWSKLNQKFERIYETEFSSSAKCRLRKKGFATTQFVAWQQSDGKVFWWLLASAGKGRVHEFEKLEPIQQTRVRISGGYELVHDGRTWSWKYRESHIQSLRMSIRHAITSRDEARLNELIVAIYATAGFRLARQQAGHLVAYLRDSWKRCRGNEPLPYLPRLMRYVRRLKHSSPKQVQRAAKE